MSLWIVNGNDQGVDFKVGELTVLPPGHFWSYRTAWISVDNGLEPIIRLRGINAWGHAERSDDAKHGIIIHHRYMIFAKGTDKDELMSIVFALEQAIGGLDITPYPLQFPDFDSFIQRVKFLFWDYLVKGETN